MGLIGRILVVLVGLFAALAAGGLVVIAAILAPEISQLDLGPVDQGALQWLIGLALIFVSGFALLPALVLVLMTEALGIRSVLAYALGGAVVGLCAYLSLVPFDSDAMRFATIDHRQLEVMTGAGILAGLVYWIIAGRSAGAWRTRSS
jgi:hypothetical protein